MNSRNGNGNGCDFSVFRVSGRVHTHVKHEHYYFMIKVMSSIHLVQRQWMDVDILCGNERRKHIEVEHDKRSFMLRLRIRRCNWWRGRWRYTLKFRWNRQIWWQFWLHNIVGVIRITTPPIDGCGIVYRFGNHFDTSVYARCQRMANVLPNISSIRNGWAT